MEEMLNWSSDNLIIIDEAGAHLGLASLYGRSQPGERIKMPVPLNKGVRLSMIAAISTQRVEAALYGSWSTNQEIFKAFIEEHLAPELKQGQIVIMDNIPFHKPKDIIEAIESTGARVKFLPEYSPDLSPIEKLWFKIKNHLRKIAPRTLNEFKSAIKKAFELVTENDLREWFKFCGYIT